MGWLSSFALASEGAPRELGTADEIPFSRVVLLQSPGFEAGRYVFLKKLGFENREAPLYSHRSLLPQPRPFSGTAPKNKKKEVGPGFTNPACRQEHRTRACVCQLAQNRWVCLQRPGSAG